MSWTDWLLTGALVLLVVRQIRGRRVTVFGLLWPVGLVAWAAVEYLRPVVDGVPGVVVGAVLVAAGLSLGVACGALTRLDRRGNLTIARASWVAAALWSAGVSARLAFGVWATNGGGVDAARLSADLGLHDEQTWATALTGMALAEVLGRTAILLVKLRRRRMRPAETLLPGVEVRSPLL